MSRTLLRVRSPWIRPLNPLQIRTYVDEPVPAKNFTSYQLEEADRAKELTSQAPNRSEIWASSQRLRSDAFNQPRFETAILDMQPRPVAAIELIAEQPIRYINRRVAVCDGGGGPRGHPKVFINVDKPGSHVCGGLRFAASNGQH